MVPQIWNAQAIWILWPPPSPLHVEAIIEWPLSLWKQQFKNLPSQICLENHVMQLNISIVNYSKFVISDLISVIYTSDEIKIQEKCPTQLHLSQQNVKLLSSVNKYGRHTLLLCHYSCQENKIKYRSIFVVQLP